MLMPETPSELYYLQPDGVELRSDLIDAKPSIIVAEGGQTGKL
jgi:hypothetical protein